MLKQKENIFFLLQVKNKPQDRETEHALILSSLECMVADTPLDGTVTVGWPLRRGRGTKIHKTLNINKEKNVLRKPNHMLQNLLNSLS